MFEVISSVLCTLLAVRAEEFFNTTPPPISSNFSCAGRTTGFYADKPANCKIYHTCDDQGNKFTYHCPAETAFRQDALICDHAHLVDCERGMRVGKAIIDPGKQSSRNSNTPFSDVSSKRNESYTTRRPFTSGTTSRSPERKYPVDANPRIPEDRSPQNDRAVITKQFFDFLTQDKQGKRKQVFIVNNDRAPQTTESNFSKGASQTGSTRHSHDSQENFKKEKSTESDASQRKPVFSFGSLKDTSDVNTAVTSSSFGKIPQSANQRSGETSRTVFNEQNNNYPYGETLRSIQDRRTVSSSATTVRSVDPYTMSLKPLVPNELQFDPYYTKDSSTTEAYYTESVDDRLAKAFQFTTPQPLLGVQFRIPNVLPDLNSLEDFVDRRKLFYIPRIKSI